MEWLIGILVLLGVGAIGGAALNRLEVDEVQLTTAQSQCAANGNVRRITVNALHKVRAHCGNGAVFELKPKEAA